MLGLGITEIIAEFYILKEDLFAGEISSKRVQKSYAIAFTVLFAVFILGLIGYSYIAPIQKANATKDTMLATTYLLKQEKEATGQFPDEIGRLARRNPTYGNLSVDSWDNEILYQKTENGENFILTSKGKDGILDTEDDIIMHKVLE
ncbi:hypothetical protein [Kordia jejudonensis]|uniref:hypothetical protein n=1 Tax=Kordia jejudonensis TaxID=1348245 RepID=UPI0006299580|nr:hypothetical protein [Kordia jejudonensis]